MPLPQGNQLLSQPLAWSLHDKCKLCLANSNGQVNRGAETLEAPAMHLYSGLRLTIQNSSSILVGSFLNTNGNEAPCS